jgi:hypothetical protein
MLIINSHMYVNVGAQGRISDAGVFSKCSFAKALEENQLNFPEPSPLPGSDLTMPFMLVADEAFPLRMNIMKPFPRRNLSEHERIFNYRLSRARRVVENAFGIFSAKFRVFRSPLAVTTSTVRKIVMATTCLHNFLRNHTDRGNPGEAIDLEEISIETALGQTLGSLESLAFRKFGNETGRIPANAKLMRFQLSRYFTDDGAVEWQRRCAGLESRGNTAYTLTEGSEE